MARKTGRTLWEVRVVTAAEIDEGVALTAVAQCLIAYYLDVAQAGADPRETRQSPRESGASDVEGPPALAADLEAVPEVP